MFRHDELRIKELQAEIEATTDRLRVWWLARKRAAKRATEHEDWFNAERYLDRAKMKPADKDWLNKVEGKIKKLKAEKKDLENFIKVEKERIAKQEKEHLESRAKSIPGEFKRNLDELAKLKGLPDLIRELAKYSSNDLMKVKSLPFHLADLAWEYADLKERGIEIPEDLPEVPAIPEDYESNLDKFRSIPSLAMTSQNSTYRRARNMKLVKQSNEQAKDRIFKKVAKQTAKQAEA